MKVSPQSLRVKGGVGMKLKFLCGLGFPVMNRKVFSSVWVALDWRLNVVRENCLQGGEGPVHRKRVLGDST